MHLQINVNGPDADPFYKFLKRSTDHLEIGWNFAKFLVVDGKAIRYT